MSSSHSKKTIETHHVQVDNSRLRKLKAQYERDHATEKHQVDKLQRHIDGMNLSIAWQIFKAVYIACVMLSLLSAIGWALGEIYDVF